MLSFIRRVRRSFLMCILVRMFDLTMGSVNETADNLTFRS
jgi:hypothetical protein